MPDLSKVENLVKDVKFPISKESLLQKAKDKGIPDIVISQIEKIDTDKFESTDDLKSKLGPIGNIADKIGGIGNMFK